MSRKIICDPHFVKSIRIRNYSGPYFPAFWRILTQYSLSLRIQSECVKIRTRITPNTDTFYAVPENVIIHCLHVKNIFLFAIRSNFVSTRTFQPKPTI